MEENQILFVAGNPDCYPIEYYNEENGEFEGLFPDLLREFAEEYDYDLRYYGTKDRDMREELADDIQVDIISGCTEAEQFHHEQDGEVVVLDTVYDGKPVSYRMAVTKAAPKKLAEQLGEYVTALDQQKIEGTLITIAQKEITPSSPVWAKPVLFLFLTVVVLLIAEHIRFFKNHRKQMKRIIEEKETDILTGIGNKDYLAARFSQMITEENRILYSACYFYVDADHMNRMSSRAETDEFLQYIARVLSRNASASDLIARVADGGFVVFHMAPGEEAAETWFESAFEKMKNYAKDYKKPFVSQVNVGVYRLSRSDAELSEILFRAEQGARAAYKAGEDCRICTEEFLEKIELDRKLQADVPRALGYEEFQLYIQFYVEARTGRIVGGEALSRWEHPELGFLLPGRFVPLLEKEGMIGRLDYYTFEKVCAFLARLHRHGQDHFFVSCNFSRDTISTSDFLPRCMEILDRYDFDRSLLIFEITESAMIKNMEIVKQNIDAVKELGMSLSLDDFGQGFTSLFDFKEIPMDVLKLDKTLIDMLEFKEGKVLIEAMIQVGHSLGISVLAEGVENDEQVESLRMMECDVIQGYRFYQPLPYWEVEKKLKENSIG
ncbi:MAG: EAL domain-containing protein [Lachnospiraceae bacterium]|nr:EAL domain-containing protein [Lachnospiraceae bacterium]